MKVTEALEYSFTPEEVRDKLGLPRDYKIEYMSLPPREYADMSSGQLFHIRLIREVCPT